MSKKAEPTTSAPATTDGPAVVERRGDATTIKPGDRETIDGAPVVETPAVVEHGLVIDAKPLPGVIVAQPTTRPLDDRSVVF